MDFYKCLLKPRRDFLVYIYMLYHSFGSGSTQCSETHRAMCFREIEGLENIYQAMEKSNAEINVTSLKETCIIFQEIKNCTNTFLDICEEDFILELDTLDHLYSALCDNIEDYTRYQPCFNKFKMQYSYCDNQRNSEISNYMQKVSTIDDEAMCKYAYEHFVCVYETTYLGCSSEAANLVRKMLNSTVTSLLLLAGIKCVLPDPPEVIETTLPATTTSPSTSTSTTESVRVTFNNFDDVISNYTLVNDTTTVLRSTVSSCPITICGSTMVQTDIAFVISLIICLLYTMKV